MYRVFLQLHYNVSDISTATLQCIGYFYSYTTMYIGYFYSYTTMYRVFLRLYYNL